MNVSRWVRLPVFYACAFVQGICLILLPASSFLFKSAAHHGLTDQQYGNLFLPMIAAASAATLAFAALDKRWGKRQLFRAGFVSNLLFLLLSGAAFFSEKSNGLTFVLLFGANFFLGLGFGLFVTVLNVLTVAYFPEKRNTVLTGLHSFLGIGAAAAPVIVENALRHQTWLSAVAAALGILLLSGAAARFTHASTSPEATAEGQTPLSMGPVPLGGMLFLGTVFIYGIIESLIGNWSVIFLSQDRGFSMETASLALSFFWLFMTVGRILATVVSVQLDARYLYRFSPAVIFAGVLGLVLNDKETLAVAIAMTAGFGCSYFFPLSISLSTQYFDGWRERLAAYAVTALMLGVGVGSSLTGVLRDRGVMTLGQIFGASLLCAGAIGVLAWKLTIKPPHAAAENREA